MLSSIQKSGELDLLLRSIEDEQAKAVVSGKQGGLFEFHYQVMLSEHWIGDMYEILRLLRQRKLSDQVPDFEGILNDLELIRMPLEKHEIAKDRVLENALEMVRNPRNDKKTDIYIYDPKDDLRAHIMATELVTATGSVRWQGIDLKSGNNRWVERRNLSDRILEMWRNAPVWQHQPKP